MRIAPAEALQAMNAAAALKIHMHDSSALCRFSYCRHIAGHGLWRGSGLWCRVMMGAYGYPVAGLVRRAFMNGKDW